MSRPYDVGRAVRIVEDTSLSFSDMAS